MKSIFLFICSISSFAIVDLVGMNTKNLEEEKQKSAWLITVGGNAIETRVIKHNLDASIGNAVNTRDAAMMPGLHLAFGRQFNSDSLFYFTPMATFNYYRSLSTDSGIVSPEIDRELIRSEVDYSQASVMVGLEVGKTFDFTNYLLSTSLIANAGQANAQQSIKYSDSGTISRPSNEFRFTNDETMNLREIGAQVGFINLNGFGMSLRYSHLIMTPDSGSRSTKVIENGRTLSNTSFASEEFSTSTYGIYFNFYL